MHIVSKINRLVALAVLHANVLLSWSGVCMHIVSKNKPALWRLLSYVSKYLRRCVVSDWVVKSKLIKFTNNICVCLYFYI